VSAGLIARKPAEGRLNASPRPDFSSRRRRCDGGDAAATQKKSRDDPILL
jgi:hypothetical protein